MLPSSSIFSADLQPCKTCSGPMLAHCYESKAMCLVVSTHLHTGVHRPCPLWFAVKELHRSLTELPSGLLLNTICVLLGEVPE